MAIDQDVLIALARLNANPDFRLVLEHMELELKDADRKSRRLSNEPLYRSQGRAVYIEEFLDRVANARANVEKMRARSSP